MSAGTGIRRIWGLEGDSRETKSTCVTARVWEILGLEPSKRTQRDIRRGLGRDTAGTREGVM